MKKIVSILIIGLLLLQLLPLTVFAEERGISYTLNPDGETVRVYYNGTDESVLIPSVIDGKKVTGIANNGFQNCDSLKYVFFQEGIKEIEEYAFAGCRNLEVVDLPESLESIGDHVFKGCSGLKNIVIPSNVKHIGMCIICNDSLETISVAEGNKNFDSRNNCNAIIHTSDNCLIAGCLNTTIPSSVYSIGERAFAGCKKQIRIYVPVSVKLIYSNAFFDCPYLAVNYAGSIEDWNQISDGYGYTYSQYLAYGYPVSFAKKAKSIISIKPEKRTYNKRIQCIGEGDVFREGSTGSVTVTYYTDKACTKQTTPMGSGCRKKGDAPQYAGIYYVKAKLASDKYYAAAVSKVVKFEIQPRVVAYKYIKKNGLYYLGVELEGIRKSVKTYYMKLYKSKTNKPLKTTGKYKPTKRAATRPGKGFKKGQEYYVKIFFKGKDRKLSPLVLSPKKFVY